MVQVHKPQINKKQSILEKKLYHFKLIISLIKFWPKKMLVKKLWVNGQTNSDFISVRVQMSTNKVFLDKYLVQSINYITITIKNSNKKKQIHDKYNGKKLSNLKYLKTLFIKKMTIRSFNILKINKTLPLLFSVRAFPFLSWII